MIEKGVEHLLRVRHYAAETSEMIHWDIVVTRKTYILYHLTGIYLDHENTLHPGGKTLYLFCRERPQGNRAQKPYLYAIGAGNLLSLIHI